MTVRRDTGGEYRIFNIPGETPFSASGATVTLAGLTIANGNAFFDAGGGIYNDGILTVMNCQISGNSADYGGGIRNGNGTLTVIGSTITGNTANASDSSGGIDNDNTTPLTLINTTISGNSSLGEDGTNGGGLWTAGPTTITNCTITDNSVVGPNSAGGIHRYSGTTTIRNSIIAANQNSSTVPDLTAVGNTGFASSGFNLIGNVGTLGGLFNQTGDQTGTGASPLNPVLAMLGNYGGPTLTHLLLAGSPARNAGTSTGAPATDQRGVARPVGAGVDIGSVENDVTLTIAPNTLPNGQMGQPYSQQLSQTGGATGTITWTVSSGDLPPGNLTLNPSTGLLSGTPMGSGTFNFTVAVTSQNGLAGVKSYTLTIGCRVISITPGTLPAGAVGLTASS